MIIEILEKKGVYFSEGLSDEEVEKIESVYEIEFPVELKKILMEVLPISEGFYNWRDFSSRNIAHIKKVMRRPFDDIEEDIESIEWSDSWGEPPLERDRSELIRKQLHSAPKLIPIFFHRYTVSGSGGIVPVFSMHGTDIIYYGENINQYFEIEFGEKGYGDIKFEGIEHIPFWSDIL